jgi:4-amino-4-deoxy-L-arabinose transferase-like glycosyltransferase
MGPEAMASPLQGPGPEEVSGVAAEVCGGASRRLFWLFAAAHVTVWTLLPALGHANFPVDTIEMLFCGHEWQLGYHKHPPLPSWISEAAFVAGGRSDWAVYLAAQAAVVLAFWAVWRLAREMVSPRKALLSVCVLDCCGFYCYSSTVLNNNLVLYPCWALGILLLFWALERQQYRYWLAAGAALGLGLLSKYTTVILIGTMAAFLALYPRTRPVCRRAGPWLMLLAALLVFSPHLYWAVAHHWSTIGYALSRTGDAGHNLGRVPSAFWFAANQLLEVLPIVLVVLVLAGGRPRLRHVEGAGRFQRDFLLAMVSGPVLAHLAVSFLFHNPLRPMYGSPLWLFLGLLLLVCFDIRPTPDQWVRAWTGWAALASIFILATLFHDFAGPYVHEKGSRTHFPGRVLAAEVESLWRRRYGQPLEIVSGDWWLAGNVAAYGKDRPRVYPSSSPDHLEIPADYCSWLGDGELNRRGGVILWNALQEPDGPPGELRQRFHIAEVLELPAMAYVTKAKVPPARIDAAIIPPPKTRR